jgi:hypothetical protein
MGVGSGEEEKQGLALGRYTSFQLQCSHHRDLPFHPDLIPIFAQMQLCPMAFFDDPF